MGKKTDPSTERLISVLPVISKIIEKVVHDHTNAFLPNENITYNYQSDFRANHSTNFCLSFLANKILKGFGQGLFTGMILIDLQKASDTTDHEILLQKLESQRGLYSGLDPILLSECFLLILRVSLQKVGK